MCCGGAYAPPPTKGYTRWRGYGACRTGAGFPSRQAVVRERTGWKKRETSQGSPASVVIPFTSCFMYALYVSVFRMCVRLGVLYFGVTLLLHLYMNVPQETSSTS